MRYNWARDRLAMKTQVIKSYMNEIPQEIQWAVLCARVRTLAQVRYCVYDLYMEGSFLFVEVKSCDDELVRHTFTIDPQGDFL